MRVGRIVRVLNDKKRDELFRLDKSKRDLIISIFYPVDSEWSTNRQALYKDLYYPQEEKFIESMKDSDEHEDYINNLTTNIYTNAPIENDGKHPIILYSPAFTCDRDSTVFIIEELIKEGYIVITLGSIYETEFTVMPNGEVIEMSEKFDDIPSDPKVWKEVIDVRKKDALFLLDKLDDINKNDEFLKGKLDAEKVGMMGFSIGTQAAFEAAADDKRIKAVALLEGCIHYSTVIERVNAEERTNTPYLLIKRHASSQKLREEECRSWYEDMEDRKEAEKSIKGQIETASKITDTQKALYKYAEGFKSFVKIDYTTHMTFSDVPMLENEEYAECLGGKIAIKQAYEIINKVTVKFFNEFLKGKVYEYQNFINNENTYPELKKINGDGEIIL